MRPTMLRDRSIRRFALLLVVVWTASGCATYVQPKVPRPPIPSDPATGAQQVAVAPAIEDLPEKLGFNLFTLFAIPMGRIHLNPNVATPRILEGLASALEGAARIPVSPTDHPDAPRLVARMHRMRFHGYWWMMPVKVVWGRLEMSVALVDADGATRWERTYEAQGRQAGIGRVADQVVDGALHSVLARAARDFASPEFSAACEPRPLAAGSMTGSPNGADLP